MSKTIHFQKTFFPLSLRKTKRVQFIILRPLKVEKDTSSPSYVPFRSSLYFKVLLFFFFGQQSIIIYITISLITQLEIL